MLNLILSPPLPDAGSAAVPAWPGRRLMPPFASVSEPAQTPAYRLLAASLPVRVLAGVAPADARAAQAWVAVGPRVRSIAHACQDRWLMVLHAFGKVYAGFRRRR